MISKETAAEKVKVGWLRVWLGFDALAVREEVARIALESLITRLDSDERVKVYKSEFGEGQKVENPLKGLAEGWSVVAKVELVVKNLSDLVGMVSEYGPSAIELLEPNKLNIDVGEAQNLLNTVADMMHRYAAAGIGGAILVHGKGTE